MSNNNYILRTKREEDGQFNHKLLYEEDEFKGIMIEADNVQGINSNPTTTFLKDYAKLNEEVIKLKNCKSIETKLWRM